MYLEINLGNSCNLKCSYCYITSISGQSKISYDIEKLIQFINKFDIINGVRFIGGEPSLYLDEIKYILTKCRNIKSIMFMTNGTLLDSVYSKFESIKDILKDIKVLFILSIDNLNVNNDRCGINGQLIFDNLIKFRDNYIQNISNNISVEINRVVGSNSVEDIEQMNTVCARNSIPIFNLPLRDYNHKILTSKENYHLIYRNIKQINMCCPNGCCTEESKMISIGTDGSLSICKNLLNRFNVKFDANIVDDFDYIMMCSDEFCNLITDTIHNECLYERLFD